MGTIHVQPWHCAPRSQGIFPGSAHVPSSLTRATTLDAKSLLSASRVTSTFSHVALNPSSAESSNFHSEESTTNSLPLTLTLLAAFPCLTLTTLFPTPKSPPMSSLKFPLRGLAPMSWNLNLTWTPVQYYLSWDAFVVKSLSRRHSPTRSSI